MKTNYDHIVQEYAKFRSSDAGAVETLIIESGIWPESAALYYLIDKHLIMR